jgi:hypothetical protein
MAMADNFSTELNIDKLLESRKEAGALLKNLEVCSHARRRHQPAR